MFAIAKGTHHDVHLQAVCQDLQVLDVKLHRSRVELPVIGLEHFSTRQAEEMNHPT